MQDPRVQVIVEVVVDLGDLADYDNQVLDWEQEEARDDDAEPDRDEYDYADHLEALAAERAAWSAQDDAEAAALECAKEQES